MHNIHKKPRYLKIQYSKLSQRTNRIRARRRNWDSFQNDCECCCKCQVWLLVRLQKILLPILLKLECLRSGTLKNEIFWLQTFCSFVFWAEDLANLFNYLLLSIVLNLFYSSILSEYLKEKSSDIKIFVKEKMTLKFLTILKWLNYYARFLTEKIMLK